VISFVGLAGEEQRQAFVNQLQIALFGWIKAHPARDRPLGGLYVMDEAQTFAPTSGKTPCTDSTNRLVAQARKYGLGLVFATQAPRNLQTKIANNCATQFLGALSGPANLDAARELVKSRSSAVEDLGVLEAGRFYAARPGEGFVKIRTPLCLSHHASALTREEIILRAGGGVGRRRRVGADDAATSPAAPADEERSADPDGAAATDR
jgi:DNA helicase HerA-like ATPase